MELTAAIPIDVQATMVIKQITLDNAAMAKVYDTMDAALKKGVVLEYEQALHYMKRAGIDPFKEAMGGGAGAGGAGKLTAGMAALGVVGIALGLLLKKMIDNSKIANTLMSNFNKGLGLMLDLILIPFVPILVGALLGFYESIMWLGEKWDGYVKSWAPENFPTDEELQKQIREIYESPATIISNLLAELKAKMGDLWVNIKLGVEKVLSEGSEVLWGIIDFLWGVGALVKDTIDFGLKIIEDTFWSVIKWLYGIIVEGNSPTAININFTGSGLEKIIADLNAILAAKDRIMGGVRGVGDVVFGGWFDWVDNQERGSSIKSGGPAWTNKRVNDNSQLTRG